MKNAQWITNRTRYKRVNGFGMDKDGRMIITQVDVRLTVDKAGGSLSLAIDGTVLLEIAMEDVADMISVTPFEQRSGGSEHDNA